MTEANVIEFSKVQRRASIARLTKNYGPMLVHVMQQSMLDDGEHVDDSGLPLCRSLDRTEMRFGATITAAQMFNAVLMARAKWELPEPTYDLHDFCEDARKRTIHFSRDHMGRSRIVLRGKYKQDLQNIERNYLQHIYPALKIEAKNDPDFNETEFWCDVFRGFADPDPSGVILRAAGIVLLDHIVAFEAALNAHRD